MEFEKSAPPQISSYPYVAHVDKSAPTQDAKMMKAEPSAPPSELSQASTHSTHKHTDPNVPILAPAPLPPASKGSWFWLTVKLIPYHILNFVLGTVAFCVVITGLCLSISLLPLCGFGILVYIVLLQIVRVLSVMDVALANTITRSQAGVNWSTSDQVSEDSTVAYQLRLAPKLARFSIRSTVAILYFATVKFALAIVSIVIVAMPLLPIASQIVADYTSDTVNTHIAGFSAHKFNFGTNPFLYFLTCVGFFVGGILLMHVFGRVSREMTRRVCGKTINPASDNTNV